MYSRHGGGQWGHEESKVRAGHVGRLLALTKDLKQSESLRRGAIEADESRRFRQIITHCRRTECILFRPSHQLFNVDIPWLVSSCVPAKLFSPVSELSRNDSDVHSREALHSNHDDLSVPRCSARKSVHGDDRQRSSVRVEGSYLADCHELVEKEACMSLIASDFSEVRLALFREEAAKRRSIESDENHQLTLVMNMGREVTSLLRSAAYLKNVALAI